jgi:hypothetical protein
VETKIVEEARGSSVELETTELVTVDKTAVESDPAVDVAETAVVVSEDEAEAGWQRGSAATPATSD